MSFSEWMGAFGQVILVVAVSFGLLCVLTSLIRFQLMSENAVEAEELGSAEERDFRLMVMNQISAARKQRRPITVVLLGLPEGGVSSAEAEAFIRPLIRGGDAIRICGENLVGMLLMCGSERASVPVERIMNQVEASGLAGGGDWRFGVAGYPDHGYKTSVLYSRARTGIEEAAASGVRVTGMASPEDVEEPKDKAPAAAIDQLTGLINEDKMIGVMRRFIAQERRQDLPVSLIYFEVDQPERLLDRYGRKDVDEMIRELAAHLDRHIRETDIIARFGQTGFVLALSASPAACTRLAGRIVEEVRRMAFRAGNGMKVTLCAGVAGYPDVIGTVVQYFVSAETALKAARARGRNQCVRFDSSLQAAAGGERELGQI